MFPDYQLPDYPGSFKGWIASSAFRSPTGAHCLWGSGVGARRQTNETVERVARIDAGLARGTQGVWHCSLLLSDCSFNFSGAAAHGAGALSVRVWWSCQPRASASIVTGWSTLAECQVLGFPQVLIHLFTPQVADSIVATEGSELYAYLFKVIPCSRLVSVRAELEPRYAWEP